MITIDPILLQKLEKHIVKNLDLNVIKLDSDSITFKTIDYCMSFVPKYTREFIGENKLKIRVIEPEKIITDNYPEGHMYAYSDIYNYILYITYCKSKLENVKYLIHNVFHELGHYCFINWIGLSFRDEKYKKFIEEFCKLTDEEGGVSVFADKYIKEKYGKKLRESGQHLLFNVDIKYHENFAELFRSFMETVLSGKVWKKLPTPMLQKLFFENRGLL